MYILSKNKDIYILSPSKKEITPRYATVFPTHVQHPHHNLSNEQYRFIIQRVLLHTYIMCDKPGARAREFRQMRFTLGIFKFITPTTESNCNFPRHSSRCIFI